MECNNRWGWEATLLSPYLGPPGERTVSLQCFTDFAKYLCPALSTWTWFLLVHYTHCRCEFVNGAAITIIASNCVIAPSIRSCCQLIVTNR